MSESTQHPRWTRRDFLTRLGLAAGSVRLYGAMTALGIVAVPPAYAGPPKLPAGSGKGKRVVIVGSGIAGLVSAYELGKAGYECTVLEATAHIGGRNRTVRHGDKLVEYDSVQTCEFDDEPHLYLNCGPARLPYHHQGILGYCRELGVALEPFVNDNRAAWVHSNEAFDGKPMRAQRLITDARGGIAELLAKAIHKDALDQEFSQEDREKLLAFMRQFGDLDEQFRYQGSPRAGFVNGEAMMEPGKPHDPYPLQALLRSDYWQFKMQFAEFWDMAATMMQPVGGMDMIVRGFVARLPGVIRTETPVTGIFNDESRVRVRYKDPGGGEREISADFCINGAPAYVAAGIDNNFSERYRAALKAVAPGKLLKIGFQARRRFWEEDDHIYGGISWTDQDILQIWYPPHGFHQKKGVVLGAYTFSPAVGDKFAQLPPEQRLARALAQGEKLHPGYSKMMDCGVSVAWQKVPYLFGCAPDWSEEARKTHYPVLRQAEGRHYMVGDQMSYHSGWQEGAVYSAHTVIDLINRRVHA
ncbi:MAG: FAD-dependent oxidoreductase [Pseudomonadota bacterium]